MTEQKRIDEQQLEQVNGGMTVPKPEKINIYAEDFKDHNDAFAQEKNTMKEFWQWLKEYKFRSTIFK